ncbi:hypothetical protein SLEP1_g53864 [Rubroshorea leprosula]|uniref:Disease resistance N-terminal domain-containing protein n=1 Tax=Rubroshorea leprosula TaxID=152421 RepID=A0AAV5MBI1_9ROSI|nr:hypothetical protein SLEP1_g53864 [Rubroshorea leprosula]
MEDVSVSGGSFLPAAFMLLLEKLDSSELLILKKKLVAELRNWKALLPKIMALLEDAKEKQVTDRAVRLWLADLNGLVHERLWLYYQIATF